MRKIIVIDRVRQGVDPEFFEEMSEFEILTAYSNEDALKVHRRENASLIITELIGSGMNAREFCSQLRADTGLRRVSVIVCCRDNEIEREQAAQCRANAVLTLPLGRAVLRHAVHRMLSVPARGGFHVRFSARRTTGTPGSTIACQAENISVTGMLIESDTELCRGERIQYALALSPESTFPVQAEVVRVEQDGPVLSRNRYGVRFSSLVPAARRAIEALVDRNPRM